LERIANKEVDANCPRKHGKHRCGHKRDTSMKTSRFIRKVMITAATVTDI